MEYKTMMAKLKEAKGAIEKMVQSELDFDSHMSGERFDSAYEAYVIIREWDDVAERIMNSVRASIMEFQKSCNKDEDVDGILKLKETENLAINAAFCFIQLAAVARGAQRGYEGDDGK